MVNINRARRVTAGHIVFVDISAILPLMRRAFASTAWGYWRTFGGVEFMACTITSLIAFAVFGVLAVGFANLPRLRNRSPPRWGVARNSLLRPFEKGLEFSRSKSGSDLQSGKAAAERMTRLICSIAASLGASIMAIPSNSLLNGNR
jgi:hypothetical protein